jgi:uracil-DNA glycosylase
MMVDHFNDLLNDVRSCVICRENLKHGVRPVLQVSPQAKIVIAGQAPGSKVHATGVPFDDPSGDRLRIWMGISKEVFYDPEKVAILPMGFCYPGKGKSGDLPPLPICAETWRKRLLNELPNIQLTLAIGQYAQKWHLESQYKTLTETVKNWRSFGPNIIPLPHPSPRNNIWLKKNDWFEMDVLPTLRKKISMLILKED